MRLEVKGISINVYINGIHTKETLSIPGPKVFYIGYNLSLQAGMAATIKDLTIDGVSQWAEDVTVISAIKNLDMFIGIGVPSRHSAQNCAEFFIHQPYN